MTEQKLVEILTLENQFEANRMKVVLEENKIPFIIKEYTDLEYGNVKGKRGWGRLESYEQFEQDILNLYKQGFNSATINEEIVNEETVNEEEETVDQENNLNERPKSNQGKKRDIKGILIIILIISTSYLGYKFYDLRQIVDRSSYDKNFTFTRERYSTLTKWRSSGKNASLAEDKGVNGMFDKFSYYDINGKLLSVSFDKDDDGIIEEFIALNIDGDTSSSYYDRNKDGAIDSSNENLSKNVNLIFIDKNFDRQWDSVVINKNPYSFEQYIKMLN